MKDPHRGWCGSTLGTCGSAKADVARGQLAITYLTKKFTDESVSLFLLNDLDNESGMYQNLIAIAGQKVIADGNPSVLVADKEPHVSEFPIST